MLNNRIIEIVAIYLRKSRADETLKDLEKHKIILVDICERYGWKYEVYEERGSSQSIDSRPEMLRLLQDIEDELYDAVLVIDQDRLSRGGGADADRVKNALLATDTVLCIRDRVLDLEDDTDATQYDFNAFFARLEYSAIVKRFQRGKKAGSKQGKWTNGPPPFPYLYNAEKQELYIDEEDFKLYRWMITSYIIDKKSTNDIAYTLNRQGNLTRKCKFWTNKTVLDTLTDQTHLGWIVTGKTKKQKQTDGSYKTITIEPKDWKINKNGLHTAVKTMEEHKQILFRIAESRNLMPHRSRVTTAKTIFPLTGLIKCGLCGYTLCIHNRKDTKEWIPIIRKCTHRDEVGKKCENSSANFQPVLDEVNNAILQYAENFEAETEKMGIVRKSEIETELKSKEKQLKSAQAALDKVFEAYEEGLYSKEIFKKQKEKREIEVDVLVKSIDILKTEQQRLEVELKDEKIDILKSFEELITNKDMSDESLNEVYKAIINRIIYTKDKNGEITLKIEYK